MNLIETMIDPPSHWANRGDLIWPPGSSNRAGTVWEHKLCAMRVIVSVSTDEDGSDWAHVSISHGSRTPTWLELAKVKDEFLGPEIEAYQVLAKRSEHVNIAEALHLWAPLDGKRRVANLHSLTNEQAPTHRAGT